MGLNLQECYSLKESGVEEESQVNMIATPQYMTMLNAEVLLLIYFYRWYFDSQTRLWFSRNPLLTWHWNSIYCSRYHDHYVLGISIFFNKHLGFIWIFISSSNCDKDKFWIIKLSVRLCFYHSTWFRDIKNRPWCIITNNYRSWHFLFQIFLSNLWTFQCWNKSSK